MKDIPGWEGLYACTTHGDIWSYRSDKFLSPSKNKRGYLHVTFTKDGKRYDYRVNRLVAMTFLDNQNNLPQVNHIDGNKLNNNIDNLEWCSNSYNTKQAYDAGLYVSKKECPIRAIDKITKTVYEFKSIRECSERLKLNRKTITSILKENKTNNYDYDFEYIKSV